MYGGRSFGVDWRQYSIQPAAFALTPFLTVFDADEVRAALTIEAAIPIIRRAMIALSSGDVRQLLRSFIGLEPGRTFAIMPAALGDRQPFGAKLVSVFQHTDHKAHEGLVVLFDGETGRATCIADAGAVTAIRTAAASAVATAALARPEARKLAVLGTGLQAEAHIRAMAAVRPMAEVRIWGRDKEKALALAGRYGGVAGDLDSVIEGADIICATTAATDPILTADGVSKGAHINLVGSSGPGQAEADGTLVATSRFIADHREHVIAHGGEFLRAKSAGLIDDDHIVAEIGEVLAGRKIGRTDEGQITIYKSLGHAVQDLAVTAWLYQQSLRTSHPLSNDG